MTTLKSRYELKRKNTLNEAIDKQLLTSIIAVVKRLQTIEFGSISALDDARDNVILDVTRLASGDDRSGLMGKITRLFRDEKTPIFDALAFGSAIKNFFPLLTQYVEAIGKRGNVDEQTALKDIAGSDDMANALRKIITKGMQPDGTLSKWGTSWVKRYMKGTMEELADQIMDASLQEIKAIAASVQQATSNVNRVADQATKVASTDEDPNSETLKLKSSFAKIKSELGELDDTQKSTVVKTLKALHDLDLIK